MLREARLAAGLSFRDLRALSGLALSHLQRLERGEVASPSPETLRRLAGGLGVRYDVLLRAAGWL